MTIKRQWTLATALVCLLVLVAGFLLLVKPQHKKTASVKTQTTAVQGQITTLKAQFATLLEEKRNIATQQAELAAIEEQLPTTPALPDMITKLDAAAAKDQVDLSNVAPGNPAAYSFSPVAAATPSASSTAAVAATPATAVPGLADIPVVLTVSGGYPQLESFLDDLEGMRRSMLVNNFTLTYSNTKSASSGPTVGAGEISATINAEVFMSTTALGSPTATPSASASS